MDKNQEAIYYACGETADKIAMLPQCETVSSKGYEILYLTDNVDEFTIKVLNEYEGKKFVNVCDQNLDLDTEEEKAALSEKNKDNEDMLKAAKEAIGEAVHSVRFTNKLKNHPVCLNTEGDISLEMERTLNSMPGSDGKIKAQIVLEINESHEIANKLSSLYKSDKDTFNKYSKLLFDEACLIFGRDIKDPAAHSALVCELMTK